MFTLARLLLSSLLLTLATSQLATHTFVQDGHTTNVVLPLPPSSTVFVNQPTATVYTTIGAASPTPPAAPGEVLTITVGGFTTTIIVPYSAFSVIPTGPVTLSPITPIIYPNTNTPPASAASSGVVGSSVPSNAASFASQTATAVSGVFTSAVASASSLGAGASSAASISVTGIIIPGSSAVGSASSAAGSAATSASANVASASSAAGSAATSASEAIATASSLAASVVSSAGSAASSAVGSASSVIASESAGASSAIASISSVLSSAGSVATTTPGSITGVTAGTTAAPTLTTATIRPSSATGSGNQPSNTSAPSSAGRLAWSTTTTSLAMVVAVLLALRGL